MRYNTDTLGMHFGFWDKHTRNRQQAMLNENQAIVDLGKIKSGQLTLDAGCGVGGTAIYIAQKTKARVVGITLDPNQVHLANQYSRAKLVEKLVEFQVQDFTKTNFAANTFDLVYAIESVCHTRPKTRFLKEVYRILKPGGHLVIADGYTKYPPKTAEEKKIIADFNWAFALPELAVASDMTKYIKQSDFENVHGESMIEAVIPTIKEFWVLGLTTFPVAAFTKYLPWPQLQAIYRNNLALQAVYKAYKMGIADYFIHTAQKPG